MQLDKKTSSVYGQQENICTLKDFSRWYNNKDVAPTLEVLQETVDFYRNKGLDLLKIRCTLPNFDNICFYKSTTAKSYPFT